MDQYQETFRTWNAVAEAYAEKFMDLDFYNESYRAFCAHLPGPSPRVLELGCGPGNVSRYLLQQCPGMQLLATDVAPNMLEVARQQVSQAQFQVLDARELAQVSGQFQGLLAGFVLPYLSPEDVRQLLADAHHLLFPSGIIYLSYIPGQPDKSGFIQGSTGQRMYLYYHETAQVQTLLAQAGFSLLHHFKIPFPERNEEHEVLICQKRQA